MLKYLKKVIKHSLNQYPNWLCKREFESQTFVRFNERPIEYAFVLKKIGQIYPQTVLDVGTGDTALPSLMRSCGCLVTAIDHERNSSPFEMFNRHYHVIADDITKTQLSEKFDLITCISVLEHIPDYDIAVKTMFSLLHPFGHLVLTFPYTEKTYVRNVYDLYGSSYGSDLSYITQSFSRNELEKWLRENRAVTIEQEYWQFWQGESWTVGNQIIPPNKVTKHDKHQLSCIHIQKN